MAIRPFTQGNFIDQFGMIGGFGGVPPITEAQVMAMTVGQYRRLLNDAIDAVQGFDWNDLREMLNDPDLRAQLTAEAYTMLDEAVSSLGSNLVALLQEGLAIVDGYADSDVIGEIFNEDPDDPGSGIDFDLEDFDSTMVQLQDHAASYGWQVETEGEAVTFTSPTYRFDPDGSWMTLGDSPERGGIGETVRDFLDTAGTVMGDALMTIIGQKEGLLGRIVSAGGTAQDLAEAWEVGTRAGEDFGDVLEYGVDGFLNGSLDVQELDARAQGAVRNFVSDLVGLIPGVGSTVKGLVFGARHSDVTLVVGSDAALFSGSAHGDRFLLGAGNDVFSGGEGRDALFGLDGNDSLNGDGGADVLLGGRGNDRLFGGAAADVLMGGAGRDLLRGGKGNDRLLGSAGNDDLAGGQARDVLSGEGGRDRLSGDAGNDRLFGGSAADVLIGGTGNDTLSGGAGNDRLTGGMGRDVFVFGPGAGRDVVTDFRNGVDRIDLEGGLGFRDVNETAIRGGVRLNFDGHPGLTLTLMGATPSQIGAEDFI